jgi:hypothetical protein
LSNALTYICGLWTSKFSLIESIDRHFHLSSYLLTLSHDNVFTQIGYSGNWLLGVLLAEFPQSPALPIDFLISHRLNNLKYVALGSDFSLGRARYRKSSLLTLPLPDISSPRLIPVPTTMKRFKPEGSLVDSNNIVCMQSTTSFSSKSYLFAGNSISHVWTMCELLEQKPTHRRPSRTQAQTIPRLNVRWWEQ